jgi:hypothetical protein
MAGGVRMPAASSRSNASMLILRRLWLFRASFMAPATPARVDAETTKEEQLQGAFDMTKSFATGDDSRAIAPSGPPINSILAAATTARDLDIAHRKAAKAKGARHASNRSAKNETRPVLPGKQDESLIGFVVRVGRLVAVQIRARGKM